MATTPVVPVPDGSQSNPFPAGSFKYGDKAVNGPIYYDDGSVLMPSYNGMLNTPIAKQKPPQPPSWWPARLAAWFRAHVK
jgi:hypothetical protein